MESAPSSGSRWFSGKCLCGQVQISVRGEPLRTGICHCTNCRQKAGRPSPSTRFGRHATSIARGETSAFRGQHFCPRCGSRLFALNDREAEIKLGVLSQAPTPLVPSYELWVKRREPWLRPIEGAVQYQRTESDRGEAA